MYQTLSTLPLACYFSLEYHYFARCQQHSSHAGSFGFLNRLFSSSLLKLMHMLLLCTELLILPHKPSELHPSLSYSVKHHCIYDALFLTCLKKDKYFLLYYSIYQLWHFSYLYNNLFTYLTWLRKMVYSLCIPLVHHWLSHRIPVLVFVDWLMGALLDGQMDGWPGR